MQKLLNFSLENIALYDDDSNEDFCVAKLEFLASGQNSHKNPIDVKVLKKYANSVLGKFVIGEYNPLKTDTTSHSDNQQIYGYVPPNGTVYFEDKKNKTFASVDAVISKIYAAPIVNMFKTVETSLSNGKLSSIFEYYFTSSISPVKSYSKLIKLE